MSNQFGNFLHKYRRQSTDPKRGGMLTQERLAELLESLAGMPGYGGVRISNWERGQEIISHDKREVLVGLIFVLHTCGGISTLEQANEFLFAGNYRHLDTDEIRQIDATWLTAIPVQPAGITTELIANEEDDPTRSKLLRKPVQAFISEPPLVSQLPGKAYRELVGRDALVDEVMAALRDPIGKWMVAIDGMGGIGKTALAREVADLCLAERLFDVVVWEQASKEQFVSGDRREGTGTLTFENALDAIARKLGALDVPRLKGAEKEARIQALLQAQQVLIVLDNLETAKESQTEIARRLRPLLNPSKALLTSRHRFKGDLYGTHLPGLDEDGALRFIRQEAEEKHINRVVQAASGELAEIATTTGGSPLALKLVVGQLGHLPLETVLGQLRNVQMPEDESDESDYVRFYKVIFFPSWRLLSDDGKKLLISMAHFAPNVGGTYEAVKATSDLAGNLLSRIIDELWRLSFLEVGESSTLKQVRYYLHALTQYFILSDIVQVLK